MVPLVLMRDHGGWPVSVSGRGNVNGGRSGVIFHS